MREAGHRRVRPVVGDAAHDREARAAVGAVEERVAVAPVGRVEQLAQAVVAGGDVGGDERGRTPAARGLARSRSRSPAASRRPRRSTRSTTASGGASARSRARNASTRRRRALHLDHHAALVVEHEARRAPSSPASRCTNGRKPTPCTTPSTRARDADRQVSSTSSRSTWYALAWASWIRGMCWERVTTTWSARPSAAISAAVVADQRDRRQPAPARLGERGEHVARAAAGRDRQQHVARAPVRDHLPGEHRLDADVVGDRGDDRRVLGEVERRPRRPAARAGGGSRRRRPSRRSPSRRCRARAAARPRRSARAARRPRPRASRARRPASARAARSTSSAFIRTERRTSATTASRSGCRLAQERIEERGRAGVVPGRSRPSSSPRCSKNTCTSSHSTW